MKKLVFLVMVSFFMLSTNQAFFSEPIEKKKKTDNKPILIMAQQFKDNTLPPFIKENIAYIESMPFDGMFIHINQSWLVMDGGKPLSYDSIYNDIGILKGVFTKFKYNYLYIFIRYPGDFWDDKVWEITAQNYAKMAKAARAVGFRGIVYDNEEYGRGTLVGKWLNYGEAYQNPKYDFNQHRDQVMLRGKQVMEAMVKEFPNLEFFNFHGPYLSETKTPYEINTVQKKILNFLINGENMVLLLKKQIHGSFQRM